MEFSALHLTGLPGVLVQFANWTSSFLPIPVNTVSETFNFYWNCIAFLLNLNFSTGSGTLVDSAGIFFIGAGIQLLFNFIQQRAIKTRDLLNLQLNYYSKTGFVQSPITSVLIIRF